MRTTGRNGMVEKTAVCVLMLAAARLDVAQSNHSVLSGTVTDRFLTAAPNVPVTLSSVERVFQTKSSAGGRFRFESVPGGEYDLEFTSPAFIKQKISVRVLEGSDQSVAIVLNRSDQPNMDYCGPHPVITYDSPDLSHLKLAGVIRAYDGDRPVARAELALRRENDSQITASAVADGKGRFQFDSVPAGHYGLQVSRKGYLPTEVTLLVPRENRVFIDIPISRDDKKIVICQ